jgi:hypothetical protein
MTSRDRLEALKAEARYRLERLALYRAKVYGSTPTTPGRLRKLQQASDQAQERLRHAEREISSSPEGADGGAPPAHR